ncbi:MAG: glycosyltransferase family 39 protein [Candidatus Eisenbacteria bacterium]
MRTLLQSYHAVCQSRWIWVITIVAVLLFSASMNWMSLKSYDDCFYARKGVEMWQRGAFFTVTWAGRTDFQYPPLQFWLLGRSFALFGKNDFAARLPSLLMAVAILLMTYRMGSVTVGRRAAMVATAALMLTPLFITNARRCQTDIPLAFWTTLAMLIYIEGLERPKLHALIAIPLGAAVLTKSVLGLFPLVVVPAAVLVPALRKTLRNGWLWLGLALGLIFGASWSIHQYVNFGDAFMSLHYGLMVFSRTALPLNLIAMLTEYPAILMEHYQPIVLPAIAGLVFFIVDRRRGKSTMADLLVVWAVLPVVLYSFSGLRHMRYLFPLLPAFAILTGYLLDTRVKKLVVPLCCFVVPILSIATTAIYWLSPGLLAGDNNQVFKQKIDVARAHLAPGTTLPYAGEKYWDEANPFLYYWDVKLEKPGDTTEEAVAKALASSHRSLVCIRGRLEEVAETGAEYKTMVEGKGWAWLRFARMEEPDPAR